VQRFSQIQDDVDHLMNAIQGAPDGTLTEGERRDMMVSLNYVADDLLNTCPLPESRVRPPKKAKGG
jgi:hypothetical protein